MKNKIIFIIFMFLALGGALILLNQNQDTRKSAAFANTSLELKPSENNNLNVGDKFSIHLFYTTDGGAKLYNVDTTICYGPEVELITLESMGNTELGYGGPMITDASSSSETKICKRVIMLKEASKITLAETTGELVDLKFKALAPGTGTITIEKDKSTATGENVNSETDKWILVNQAAGTTYTIGTLSTGCNLTVNPPRLCPTGYYCKTISELQGADGVCTEGCDTNADCPSGQVCSNHVCTIVTTDVPILNYKVTYGGVIVHPETKCAVNWPVQIVVLSAGETKIYTDIPTEITSTGTNIEYKGSLALEGFNHLSNVAAFLKGPKHLQMKYATQNQSGRYNKAGGELVLTTSADTSVLYNFTGYPMLAGDLVGATINDGPDGEINGVDFAYLKSLPKYELGAAGTSVKGDLDGNCMLTSNDVAVLRISLQEKQGELY